MIKIFVKVLIIFLLSTGMAYAFECKSKKELNEIKDFVREILPNKNIEFKIVKNCMLEIVSVNGIPFLKYKKLESKKPKISPEEKKIIIEFMEEVPKFNYMDPKG